MLQEEAKTDVNVELLRAPEESRDKPFNFAVMMKKPCGLNRTAGSPKATASMNLPEVAKTWANYFDELAIKSTPLPA